MTRNPVPAHRMINAAFHELHTLRLIEQFLKKQQTCRRSARRVDVTPTRSLPRASYRTTATVTWGATQADTASLPAGWDRTAADITGLLPD